MIEILSVSLDQDKGSDESPDFEQLAGNPLHKNIQRQLQVCSDVVERITVEHHGSLNSSVQAMGGVARHYNQTRANVGTLREQLRECKQLLQTGVSQTDVRELWQRKLQYSLVLRLLNALDMIKVSTCGCSLTKWGCSWCCCYGPHRHGKCCAMASSLYNTRGKRGLETLDTEVMPSHRTVHIVHT